MVSGHCGRSAASDTAANYSFLEVLSLHGGQLPGRPLPHAGRPVTSGRVLLMSAQQSLPEAVSRSCELAYKVSFPLLRPLQRNSDRFIHRQVAICRGQSSKSAYKRLSPLVGPGLQSTALVQTVSGDPSAFGRCQVHKNQ